MLKKILLNLSLLGALLSCSTNVSANNITNTQPLSSFDALKWENRIVIIRAHSSCETITNQLINSKIGIDERHIIWFIICNRTVLISNYQYQISSTLSNYIISSFFERKKQNIILIGKDSGIKYRALRLNLDTIYKRIDSMPMRQEEMQNLKSATGL